jgi:TolA-binding protein
MSRPCHEIEAWLGRPRETLSEGQALALEQHLATCGECRALQGLSHAVGQLVRSAPGELSRDERERAIAGAFLRAARPAATVRTRPLAWFGVAVAATLALTFAGRALWPREAPLAAKPPATTPAPEARESPWIEAEREETRTFAHATVRLAAGSKVRFDAARALLELDTGELDVAVDPAPQAPFAVLTRQLRVVVLGTQFHIDERNVSVQHGRVRVVDRSLGSTLELQSGEHYAQGEKVPAPGPQATTAPARKRPRVAADARTAGALIEQARAALAEDELGAARTLLAQVEHRGPTPAEHAEAGTLRAEIALRDRDVEGAIRMYLEVARRHPKLAAGETALFAAAQLHAKRADSQALLQQYLERYPQGRFVNEARKRLGISAP